MKVTGNSTCEGTVASGLPPCAPDQAVQVLALARDIGQDTLISQVYWQT